MAAEMIVLASREEWLKNRTRIGGSEASAVVGLNPYCSNVQLWEQKTGLVIPEDISDKPYIQYGQSVMACGCGIGFGFCLSGR